MNKPKQIVPEPFELLKSVTEQVVGTEPKPPNGEATSQTQPDKLVEEQQLAQKLHIQGQRQLQALEAEMAEIRHQRENKNQEDREPEPEGPKPLEILFSKPDRKFAGKGLGAKRMQTHVEKPLTTSG